MSASSTPDYRTLIDLKGRRIVVLGGGFGMGRETCTAFSQLGARILCVDNDKSRASQVAEELNCYSWSGDMTQEADVKAMADYCLQCFEGPVDGLVDIIGIASVGPILDMDESIWDAQSAINLKHAYLVIKHLGRQISESGAGGTMTFIASVNGLVSSVNRGAYGAAKAGLISLVKTAAHELGASGIRCNAIAPGAILTPRIKALADQAGIHRMAAPSALARPGRTSDIASTAVFLTSELSAFITGQTIVCDGGATVRDPFASF